MSVPKTLSNRPLYNSRIIDNYIKLIKKKYNFIDIKKLLRHAGMEPYEVADQGHWFTQDQINRFQEMLAQLTQNRNIAREAGQYSVSPEALGAMRQWVLGIAGLATAYEMIGKGSANFTRSTTFETKRLASNKVEITVTPRQNVQEQPFQCENRKGYLESVALLFGYKLPQIEHPVCLFHGGDVCRYIISWEKSIFDALKRIRNYSAVALFLLTVGMSINHLHFSLSILLPCSLVITLLLTMLIDNMEKNDLKSSLGNLQQSTDDLVEQININYNNALLTNEIGLAISKQTSSRDILFSVVQIFKRRLDYDRCMILLADNEQKRLLFRAGYGYSEEQLKLLNNYAFRLDKERSRGVFVVSFREQRPFLINDIGEIVGDLSLRSLNFAKKLGTQSFICCPIVCDGKPMGILAVDNLRSKRPLVQSDMSLLVGIASVLGVSIRNAELIESRERQFKSILHALAASIDARDPMTSGHSEKVTEYAVGICAEMDLSKEYQDMIRVAALLHDYGKIGIPDTILKKPGKLTSEEYEVVKTHAVKTSRILQQINFEGIYKEVPNIAGSHHEKIDGSGYPDGLKGDAIPLGAKIIAVADFFEAITARRHYRGPIPLIKAFEMLQTESGKTFDPNIVNAFLRYYAKTHAGEPDFRSSMMRVS